MAYADDLACWSEDGETLRRVVMSFKNKLEEAGMGMNVDKTEIMVVKRGEEERLVVEVDGLEIKNVEKSKYLGGLFGREGGSALEISSRIDQYGRTVRALYPIIRDRWMGE